MQILTRHDLYSLERYAESRSEFRARVMEHKKARRIAIGPHLNLYFEDRLTIQYQVQEMLRIEKIFEAEAIEDELSAYNPLIPDGDNWKATMMIEYDDVEERKLALAAMVGIEKQVWVAVGDTGKVYAIADEDLERADADKTSAVHFLRFQLPDAAVAAAHSGAAIGFGVDHDAYRYVVEAVDDEQRAALIADLGACRTQD